MRVLGLAARSFLRELRSGELTVLVVALVVAVASLTAVGFFTSRIARGMAETAGEVLAADLRLESGRPMEGVDRYTAEALRHGLSTASVLAFPSVVYGSADGRLASLRGVSVGYPLRGAVRVAQEPFGAAHATSALPRMGEVWADARLLIALDTKVGGTVTIGGHPFRVSEVLDYRPDQGTGLADLAPTVLLNEADLRATGLVGAGSRATWALLVAGEPGAVAAYGAWLRAHKGAGERLVDVMESSTQSGSALTRAQRFLNLAALATILLAAIAVAIAARRYARRHLDAVALQKCLGASQGFVFALSAVELGLAALLATAIGTAAGYGAQAILAELVSGLIAGRLPGPTIGPALAALATATIMMAGFALPSLLELRRTPPGRVLSRNLAPATLRYGLSYLIATLALVAIVFVLVGDARLVGYVAGAVAVAGLVLYGSGLVLVKATGMLRGHAGVAWRYGLANVARRGAESAVQVVAFGLGITVLLLLIVVRGDLLRDWRRSLPADAPNQFLINIRPDEVDPLVDLLHAGGLARPVLYPWVRARLTDINDVSTERLHYASDRARAFAEREQNLSWSRTLPADNRIDSGAWWSAPPPQPEVSVASEYADDLGIRVGDRLGFDVAGERIVARVASVRHVRWDGFRPNFFLMFSPGALDASTGTYMTSLHVDAAHRATLAGLARRFPGITVFDVEAILEQVRGVMDRAAIAVEYVSLFSLLAGIVVLLATVQATRDERRYESATLRTLGASRALVLGGVAVEFVAIGLLAGALAAAATTAAAYVLATRVFTIPYSPDLWIWVYGPLAGAALVGAAGVLAARRATLVPPTLVLRAGG